MKTVKVLGLKPSEMPGKVLAMPVNCPRNLQPTVEHVEESEIETIESPQARRLSKSYFDSSLVSSDDSMASTPDEEIPTPPRASLCRRDVAHEIATSLWGLVPPKNFDLVMPSVYRCSFPQTENFPFLKSLGLKTILTLVPDEYPEAHRTFMREIGIQHFQIGIEPNKNPFVAISQPCHMFAALGMVLDRSNHPLLIHCNKGKHRTGCVVGCLRKIQGWDFERIFAEYHRYAGAKARVLDERFMELFDERGILWLARSQGFLPADPPNTATCSLGGMGTARLRS